MRVQIDIGFDQLVQMVRELPPNQWVKLKDEVEKRLTESSGENPGGNSIENDLESFLLSAPTFTEAQFEQIAETRKAISKWRKR